MSSALYYNHKKTIFLWLAIVCIFWLLLMLMGNSEEKFPDSVLTPSTEGTIQTTLNNETVHQNEIPTQDTKNEWQKNSDSSIIDQSDNNISWSQDLESTWDSTKWAIDSIDTWTIVLQSWSEQLSWKFNEHAQEDKATTPTQIVHDISVVEIASWTTEVTGAIVNEASITTGDTESHVIVHSAKELIPLVSEWLLLPSFDPDSHLANSVLFGIDIYFRSWSESIQVIIPKDTIISTEGWVPFDTQALELSNTNDSDYHSSIRVEKYDEFTNTYNIQDVIQTEQTDREEFHFGIPWQHLIFTKPLEVTIDSNQWEGTLVDLSADHGEWWSKAWISISSSTECSGGIASEPWTITKVQNGKVTFFICWASTFALTYVGGANFANFADASIAPGFIDKTVTFASWVQFATWSIISDVDIRIRRRPIDTQNPASFGNTNCYPNEKYFRLTGPDGTIVNLINSSQLNTPNPSCPETTTTFDQSWSTVITNNYSSGTYIPVGNLWSYNGKSPFGVWTLRMGDIAALDGVILYEYTITIKVIDPPLCIYSPVSVLTWIVVKNTSQVIDQQFDFFQVDDQRWLNSGYYTTLQLSNLNQVGWSWVINNSNIQWRADPLVLLGWTANPLVQLWAARWSYTNANTTSTFIFRNTAPNSFRTSRYGSRLRLRVNVPAYANVGTYDGTITYTLYEN